MCSSDLGRASGGDIVMNMRARLENDIKTATSPQIQQLAQKRLQGFMEDPRISKIANMTNEEILAEIPKAIENIALKDPQYIRQKALDDAKNAARLQEHRITAAATSAHSNLSSIGKDAYAIAAGNGRKTPNEADWEAARGGYRPNTEESKGFYFVDANGNRYANKEDVPPNVSVRIEQYVKKSDRKSTRLNSSH